MQKYFYLFIILACHVSILAQVQTKEKNNRPEVASARWLQTKGIPVDTTFNPESAWQKIRKDYPQAEIRLERLPQGVKEARNVVYATLQDTPFGVRNLHLDVFYPEAAGSYPALIMVHGGGWRSGNKSMQVPLAQQLAAKGFVTIAVEYQLSLEAKYPAAVHNLKAAVRWVRANSEKYAIDPDKIAISGASAGGQLAALVGMTNNIPSMEGKHGSAGYSSSVQAVIDIDGVLDFLAPASLNLDRNSNSADVAWFGGFFHEIPLVWKEASSIYWVNENSVPVLFINSGYPRFHAGQDEMIGILNRHGIYHEVRQFDVMVHPFWLFDPWVEPTVVYMADFLHKIFNDKKS